MFCLSPCPLEGLFPFGGSECGGSEGLSERWCDVYVLGVCVASPGIWVSEFHPFVVGCCFVGAFVSCRVSLCIRLLETGVMDVVSLG